MPLGPLCYVQVVEGTESELDVCLDRRGMELGSVFARFEKEVD